MIFDDKVIVIYFFCFNATRLYSLFLWPIHYDFSQQIKDSYKFDWASIASSPPNEQIK